MTLAADLSRNPSLGKDAQTYIIQLYTWEAGKEDIHLYRCIKILCSKRVYTEVDSKYEEFMH
jgi:hypothetical protein